MKPLLLKLALSSITALGCLVTTPALADGAPTTLIGKNDWLFTRYEFADPGDAPDTQASAQLLQKVIRLFEAKDIAVALVMVPSKIRIHADQLPDERKLDAYTAGKYEAMASRFQAAGVPLVNLNQAFLNSPHRTSDTPLFFRLDTHWSPSGALLAAETVKADIERSPRLKAALAATPEQKYQLVWDSKKISQRGARDLLRTLPRDSRAYSFEKTLAFKVTRESAQPTGLLSAGDTVGITVIGSSYTHKNTGYPDGLRYTLQRDVLDISIPVDQGPWVGLLEYLGDESYQTSKPKLIIWEIPEREMRSPPDYPFRDPRYIMDNEEWLARVTALIQ